MRGRPEKYLERDAEGWGRQTHRRAHVLQQETQLPREVQGGGGLSFYGQCAPKQHHHKGCWHLGLCTLLPSELVALSSLCTDTGDKLSIWQCRVTPAHPGQAKGHPCLLSGTEPSAQQTAPRAALWDSDTNNTATRSLLLEQPGPCSQLSANAALWKHSPACIPHFKGLGKSSQLLLNQGHSPCYAGPNATPARAFPTAFHGRKPCPPSPCQLQAQAGPAGTVQAPCAAG